MVTGPKQQSVELARWIAEIDKYPPNKDGLTVDDILPSEKAKEALYAKTKPPKTSAREDFLTHLYTVLNDFPSLPKNKTNAKAITLETLLDPTGLKLYEAAIKEERESTAFRDAVLLKSTSLDRGPKWAHRLIMPLGGPSAAGKTVGAKAAIKAVSEKMEKDPSGEPGNIIVQVDGGMEREVSQMRQMVLQVALSKGYKGIEDLHDKTELGIKGYVEDAALEEKEKKVNLVIPLTYTSEVKDFAVSKVAKLVGASSQVGKSDFKSADKEDNGEAIVVFGIVRAEYGNVLKSGDKRAWNSRIFERSEIRMNNQDLPCESKAYSDHWKFGTDASEAAFKAYQDMSAEEKMRMTIEITSDFTFAKPVGGEWVLAGPDETWNPTMVGLTKRDFEKFRSYAANVVKHNVLKTIVEDPSVPKSVREEKEKELSKLLESFDPMANILTLQKMIADPKVNDKVKEEINKALKSFDPQKNVLPLDIWVKTITPSPTMLEVKLRTPEAICLEKIAKNLREIAYTQQLPRQSGAVLYSKQNMNDDGKVLNKFANFLMAAAESGEVQYVGDVKGVLDQLPAMMEKIKDSGKCKKELEKIEKQIQKLDEVAPTFRQGPKEERRMTAGPAH